MQFVKLMVEKSRFGKSCWSWASLLQPLKVDDGHYRDLLTLLK
jgi:hypothetical protein